MNSFNLVIYIYIYIKYRLKKKRTFHFVCHNKLDTMTLQNYIENTYSNYIDYMFLNDILFFILILTCIYVSQ